MDPMVVRRRATKEELQQGMKEMEESQKRIEAENRIRGEEPIEDQRSPEGESKFDIQDNLCSACMPRTMIDINRFTIILRYPNGIYIYIYTYIHI